MPGLVALVVFVVKLTKTFKMTPQRRILFSRLVISLAMVINAFKSRVLGDGGTFEAENYLLTQSLATINSADFVLFASGSKSGKVYAFKPTNGTGDLTFSRASSGYRFNPYGVLESIGSNIPRINYIAGVPALLLEPLRTNIFFPSDPSSGGNNATFAANDWGIGFTNKCILNNSSGGSLIYTAQPTTVQINTTYSASFYVKIIDGTVGTPIFGNGISSQGYFNFCGTAISSDSSYKKTSLGNNIWRIEVTGTSGAGSPNNTGFLRWTSNKPGSIEITGIQIELAPYSSSYIATTTGAVTRVGDSALINNATSFVGQNSGTIFASYIPYIFGVSSSRIFVSTDDSLNNRIWLVYNANNTITCFLRNNSGSIFSATSAATQTNGINKIAIAYANNDIRIYLNGSPILSSNATLAFNANRNSLYIGSSETSNDLNQIYIVSCYTYLSVLSNSELADLTI